MDSNFNALSFVKDPRDIVKTGELVTVIVMEVDAIRKRIPLTIKSNPESNIKPTKPKRTTKKNVSPKPKLTEKPQGYHGRCFSESF
jgi:transcriptional accessory protein Tex/SPT6